MKIPGIRKPPFPPWAVSSRHFMTGDTDALYMYNLFNKWTIENKDITFTAAPLFAAYKKAILLDFSNIS
jgi:hypothetical protein